MSQAVHNLGETLFADKVTLGLTQPKTAIVVNRQKAATFIYIILHASHCVTSETRFDFKIYLILCFFSG